MAKNAGQTGQRRRRQRARRCRARRPPRRPRPRQPARWLRRPSTARAGSPQIWHDVTHNEVMAQSASLADGVALRTSDLSVAEIAAQIAEVVLEVRA